jgi:hypothetical protein
LPLEPLLVTGLSVDGDAASALFFLFLSAFGFFFSRLLLNCPFAISSSLRSWRGVARSQRLLFLSTFFTRVGHAGLTRSGPDAIGRATLSAFGLDTSLTSLDGEVLAFQRLFHQTFGLVAQLLF